MTTLDATDSNLGSPTPDHLKCPELPEATTPEQLTPDARQLVVIGTANAETIMRAFNADPGLLQRFVEALQLPPGTATSLMAELATDQAARLRFIELLAQEPSFWTDPDNEDSLGFPDFGTEAVSFMRAIESDPELLAAVRKFLAEHAPVAERTVVTVDHELRSAHIGVKTRWWMVAVGIVVGIMLGVIVYVDTQVWYNGLIALVACTAIGSAFPKPLTAPFMSPKTEEV